MEVVKRRLERATNDERDELAKILGANSPSTFAITAALQKQSKSVFGRWFGKDLTYREILMEVAIPKTPFKPFGPKDSITILEDRVAEMAFDKYRASLSPEARAELDQKLDEVRENLLRDENGFGKLGGGLLVAQLAAQASGFGVYMMASSVVAGLTHAVGVTLPFAAFTGMSSLISWVIGPVGIAISAGMILYQLFRNDMSRSIAAVSLFARIRHRTALILKVSLGDESVRNWFQQVEECRSVAAVQTLRSDLEEHGDALCPLCGFWIISALCELLCVPRSGLSSLEHALATTRRLKTASEMGEIAERAVAQVQRLLPERVYAVMTCFDKFVPSAAVTCYAQAPQDSDSHYASVMLLAARLVTR